METEKNIGSKCRREKPMSEFYRSRCLPCYEYDKKYKKQNTEEINRKNREKPELDYCEL